MRHSLCVITLPLLAATSAYADPIPLNAPSLPPQPKVLGALLIEVLVVAALIRGFKLRTVRFIAGWYAVNLFTFCILLQGSILLSHSKVFGEVVVVAAEAAVLFGVSRMTFFKKADSKPIPLGWAAVVSLAGNLASMFAFAIADGSVYP
jgi:hypothetical protein